jgi:acetyltransferase-like isoleucine patch superfamily enzyme
MNFDYHIGLINRIEIGNNLLIGSRLLITNHSHGEVSFRDHEPPGHRPLYSKSPVIIKYNVWIGEAISFLPNVTIGIVSVIAAGGMVIKSIPQYYLAAGVQAKVIKRLNIL